MLWFLAVALTFAQGPAGERAPMAEEVFKNVQILKGIPVDQFMGTMGFFSASLGLNCTDCHTDKSGGDWARYADENPRKQTARRRCILPGREITAHMTMRKKAHSRCMPEGRASEQSRRTLLRATPHGR